MLPQLATGTCQAASAGWPLVAGGQDEARSSGTPDRGAEEDPTQFRLAHGFG